MRINREQLPDQLCDGLKVVFVGTAAGRHSAETRAYYAHPGNRFWRTLHEVGLTPREFEPHEYRDLLELGVGFTDIAKMVSGMDHEIDSSEFEPRTLRREDASFQSACGRLYEQEGSELMARPADRTNWARETA